MFIKELLQLLDKVAIDASTSRAVIVGGLARDRVLNALGNEINDVDLTTGDRDIAILAKEFAITLRKQNHSIPIEMKQAKDGHISIYIQDVKLDFSSNFRTPNIVQILQKLKGISNPTNMQQELYSRDFTCNTLLMSLDFRRIKDITHQGIRDIGHKIIRTCLTPELTFKYNTNRIIRVIYMAAKLEFDVEPNIIDWIKSNPKYIVQSENSYLSKNIDKSLSLDPDRTIYLINKMELWKYIPITEKLAPYYSKAVLREINV